MHTGLLCDVNARASHTILPRKIQGSIKQKSKRFFRVRVRERERERERDDLSFQKVSRAIQAKSGQRPIFCKGKKNIVFSYSPSRNEHGVKITMTVAPPQPSCPRLCDHQSMHRFRVAEVCTWIQGCHGSHRLATAHMNFSTEQSSRDQIIQGLNASWYDWEMYTQWENPDLCARQ